MALEISELPFAAAIVGADGRMRESNARWQARFGHCERLDADFREAAARLREAIEKRVAQNASIYHASFLVRAPGELAPLRLSFSAIQGADDAAGATTEATWLLVAQEQVETETGDLGTRNYTISEAELAMDGVALRLHARNWRAFFHNSAAGKALIGLQGETLEVNRALTLLLDRSENELLQILARDLRHPDDRDAMEAHYQRLLEDGLPLAGIETRYRHQDGRYLNCLVSLSLIRDSRQRPLCFAAEVEDITARRQIEARLRAQTRELARANWELTRSNADLERFAFVASHDLQEPLRKIRVFGDRLATLTQQRLNVESLGVESSDAEMMRYVEVMTRSARRMQNLVNDLLAYGRLSQSDAPFVTVDLNALWDELREEFEMTLRASGAQLQVEALPHVRGNPFRLCQLFGNLLSNALKFRDGEQPPRITVRALEMPATDLVAIEVADNGIGFDEIYAETIFEVFTRLHGRSRYPGTGIGLSICRNVARQHGGDVRAFSAPEQGARFVVTLTA